MADGPVAGREHMLVIVGAGASFDCLPTHVPLSQMVDSKGLVSRSAIPFGEARPPVTQGLVGSHTLTDWAKERWPWAVPVVAQLLRTLQGSAGLENPDQVRSFESELKRYDESAVAIPERRRHVLAMRFYLRDLFTACTGFVQSRDLGGGATNYVSLVNDVMEWCAGGEGRVATFVSFNYDLLLEHALERQIPFNHLDLGDYLAHPRLKLLKPHGSIAWHWSAGSTGNDYYGSAVQIGEQGIQAVLAGREINPTVIVKEFPIRFEAISVREWLIPAIALPTEGKTEFVWPPEQAAHLGRLEGRVTRLLTIGWRGLEPHFLPLLEPLLTGNARILVVSGGDRGGAEADGTLERLRETLTYVRTACCATYAEGFGRFLEAGDRLVDFVKFFRLR